MTIPSFDLAAGLRHAAVPRLRPGDAWRMALLVLAIGLGALAAVSPTLAVIVTATGLGALWSLALGERIYQVFLAALAALLVGYAFLGRGLAHVGIGQLYVGEPVLLLGLAAVLVALPRVRITALHVLVVLFMGWGALRTIPYLGTYGWDALRDGALWGYATFALAVSVAVRAHHFDRVARVYGATIPLFLAWAPVGIIIARLLAGAQVPFLKGGDVGVHLAGIAAFLLLGLYERYGRGRALGEPLMWAGWLLTVGVVGAINRGGLIAAGMASAAFLFVRSSARWLRMAFTALLVLSLLLLVNPRLDLPGSDRTVSFDQLLSNALSIVGEEEQGNLQGTKEWRLLWWDEIISYTLEGPHFWLGKGFGLNVAVDDGFQGASVGLRSPHSAHLTVLARSGVPGLVLWTILQVVFAVSIVRAAFRARAAGEIFWTQVFGWIFVYWLAAIVNASFDVYLEGPQGAIWFWAIFGSGMAALTAAPRFSPVREVANVPASEPRPSGLFRAPNGHGSYPMPRQPPPERGSA